MNVHATPSAAKVIKADTPEKLAIMVETVRDEMADGNHYKVSGARNRNVVNHSLDTMAQMPERKGSVFAMSQEDRTRLFNTQEEIMGSWHGILRADSVACFLSMGSLVPMTEY